MFSFIDNFIELEESILKYYAGSSMEKKWHLLCVNYIPLTAYSNNTLVYGMLHRKGNSPAALTMRRSGNSEPVLAGRFRSVVLNTDSIVTKLRRLQAVDVRTETARVLEYLPAEEFNNLARILIEVYQPFNSPCYAEIAGANNLVATINSIKNSFTSSVLQDEQVSTIATFVRKAFEIITKLLNYPEDIVDLLAYIECIEKSPPVEVSMIEELSAINIKTKAFELWESSKGSVDYDQYMFHANYALLSVFVSNLAAKEYYSPKQSIFKALTEFVPLAMKFTGVDNPLLDINPSGKRVWNLLSEKYNIIKTSVCVTNFCKMNGGKKDVDDTEFNPLDSATDQISRIYYVTCCDLNSVFKSSSQVATLLQQSIVPKYEKWRSPSAVVFTPTLSEALVLALLLDLSEFVSSDEYLVFNKQLPSCWLTYSKSDSMNAADQVDILAVKFFSDKLGIHNSIDVSSREVSFIVGLITECLVNSLRNSSKVSLSALTAMAESMYTSLRGADLEILGEEWLQ